MQKFYNPKDYGAAGDGSALDTAAIQAAADAAGEAATAESPQVIILTAGTYLTSSIFLHSNTEFRMEEGSRLLATTDESQYPIIPGRIAGIEMEWPSGVLNILGKQNVKITGHGIVDGEGPYWWNKYWGKDRKGGMRGVYEPKGLRWCVDYDCKRLRNVVVMNSENIVLSDFESTRSGFWNVHVCYSSNVLVTGLYIFDNMGPSTDGIDIDSCDGVVVEKCRISCNDDSICVKSGRDADGLRVNRICQNVEIRDCEILEGAGVTIGSETSGGARNITIRNIKFKGTHNGFRIKSARTRGGLIEDVLAENLEMEDVVHPINMHLDWNPSYSYCELPSEWEGEMPSYWHTLLEEVPEEKGIPAVRNITVRNVVSRNTPEYDGVSEAFNIFAFAEKPISNVLFENINISAKAFGSIASIHNVTWKDVTVTVD